MSSPRRAAQAVSAMAKTKIRRHTMPTEMAVVQTIQPLTVELVNGGLTLGEDILILGSAFRKYDRDFGVEIGDTVALTRQASGDYYVADVQTQNEVVKGIDTDVEAGTSKKFVEDGTGAGTATGTITGSLTGTLTGTITGTADLVTGAVTGSCSVPFTIPVSLPASLAVAVTTLDPDALAVAHWMKVYDKDGNELGFVPVFASKT